MYIHKLEEGSLWLLKEPEGFHPLVYGCYGFPTFRATNCENYFAFIAPEGTALKPGSKAKGIKYAEGGLDEELEVLKEEVEAFRRKDGGYAFNIILSQRRKDKFILFPNNSRRWDQRSEVAYLEDREVSDEGIIELEPWDDDLCGNLVFPENAIVTSEGTVIDLEDKMSTHNGSPITVLGFRWL